MIPNSLEIKFTCGGSFDKDGKPMDWPQVQAAMETVEKQLLADFGGYSKNKSYSARINPATKTLVEDQSIVYTAIVPLDTPEMALRTAQACCVGAFNQTSVPLTVTQVYSQF